MLSATRLLPLPAVPVGVDDRRRLARELRDVHWNPQRHLPNEYAGALRKTVARKKMLIAQEPIDAAGRRERFQALRAATAELRAPLSGREKELHQELERTDLALQTNAVLRRRDYAFCLFPEEALRPFCTQFL